MAVQGKDPSHEARSGGGYLDIGVFDLANGTGALVVIQATAASTTVVNSTASAQIVAANPLRYALKITNNAASDLWVATDGGAASVGGSNCFRIPSGVTAPLPPLGDGQGPNTKIVNGIWAAADANGAAVLEISI